MSPNTAARPLSVPFFGAVSFPQNAYCEPVHPSGALRQQWRPIIEKLQTMGGDLLNQGQEKAQRMRHEDGATFNPFEEIAGVKQPPWSLEMIPLPISADEWGEIERGILQRAYLLEQILADIYGKQSMLKAGRLPPELIYANPNFLHACHGIHPAGNRYLTFLAVDIYRAADGKFRVLRDHGSIPAGLGYALENRIVVSRIFSDLYQNIQVRRLAPFFQTLHHNLIQRAALRKEDPGIALLSPGPDCPIYFEHALLSRYLGYPLVEGQDLTVRNGKVFQKKLGGLEPVEAIFRHVADGDSDPFALRRESVIGVAGLIQASREQNIDMVNPIGSGYIDTPALSVFMPEICRHLLAETLLLENHPAWWCGMADGLNHTMENIHQLSIASAMDRAVEIKNDGNLVNTIQAMPHYYLARTPVQPSVVPAWHHGNVEIRHTILRVFACATKHGFSVMPGGLAVTAPDIETLVGNRPERQRSKDLWVISDQPVTQFSLMDSLQTASEVKRGSDLPSRVADYLLWLGRYLERAEGVTRLLRCVFQRLSGEDRPADIPELPFLLNLLRANNIIPTPPETDDRIPTYWELWPQLNTALFDKERAESVPTVLKQVHTSARHVRDRLSLDSWQVINRLDAFASQRTGDPLDLLHNILFTLSAFSGLAMESMTRGLGWRFMDMGRRVERALYQTALIHIGLPSLNAESHNTLKALLEVADSIMTYRARYRTTFQLIPVLDLLLMDEDNPKSLAFQLNQLSTHVHSLPQNTSRRYTNIEERIALEMLTAVRLLDLGNLNGTEKQGGHSDLNTFLEVTDKRLKEFAQHISAHYLSRVPATPHFSMIHGDP